MKTVLNKVNVPVEDRLMFFGPDLSIQRYDQFKYPKFFELFEKQENFRWRAERIDLSKDRTDFEKLTPVERFVFEENIRWQTMTDSMLSRSIHEMSGYVTNPELEICMSTWASMEAMHSFSYTHIFKNVTKNATAFFDSILENAEIVKRAHAISESYDKLLDDNTDIKQRVLNAVICTNITEGISFYNSFVCSFFFGYRGLMEGSAKIIGEIARDECLIAGTEVLTDKGWKKIENFDIDNDWVAQFNQDKTIEFVKSSKKTVNHVDEELLRFHNQKGHVDFIVTQNHRIVYEDQNKNIRDKLAKDYSVKNVRNRLILSGKKTDGTKQHLTQMERFLIALQADGSLTKEAMRNGKYSGCIPVFFSLKKEKKITRLEALLHSLNFEYSKNIHDIDDCWHYYVKIPKDMMISKTFNWVDLKDVTAEWCTEFIEEMSNWDGHLRYGDLSSIYYSSTSSYNADIVQAIACFAGYRCHRGIQVDNRKESYQDVHRLSLLPMDFVNNQCMIKEPYDYKGHVYCLTVPSGMFVMRYNNKVCITGNCLHVQITQTIIKNWKTHPEEGFQELLADNEELIYELYKTAVNNEKDWANYLFSKGSLMGLNAEILHQYIEWLANTRLNALGYRKIFEQKTNPVSWCARYFDSSKVQVAPQESELESYLVGSANTSLKDSDFDEIQL